MTGARDGCQQDTAENRIQRAGGQSASRALKHRGEGSDVAIRESSLVYSKELLLSLWLLPDTSDAASHVYQATRNFTLHMQTDTMPCDQASSFPKLSEPTDTANSPYLLPPSAADIKPVPPPGLTPSKECRGVDQQNPFAAAAIGAAAAPAPAATAARRDMHAAGAAVTAPEAVWKVPQTKLACSWGAGGDFSSLIARLRHAQGARVPLAVLRQEAPSELRGVMRDGATFATWLSHRTGLVEVCGALGKEVVVLSTPGTNMSQPEAIGCFSAQGSFFFDKTVSKFPLSDKTDAAYTHAECSGPLGDDALLAAAAAEAASERIAHFQEQHKLCTDMHFWQLGDHFAGWWPEYLAWQSEQALSSPLTVRSGGLDPNVAEFRPAMSLAEYSQTRKLGTMRQKAGRSRQEFEASCIPNKILEEPITCSEDTTSGDEDRGTSSDTTSNGEEESLPMACTATA